MSRRATRGTPAAAAAAEEVTDPIDVPKPGEVPECVKRGAFLYREVDDVDLHYGTDTAYGPQKNLYLWKLIRILKSGTKFIIKCQMPGDECELDGIPIEDIIAGIKLYERLHSRKAATETAAPPPAPPPAQPPILVRRTANVVTARFGLQANYTGSEYLNSNFFSSFELDLTKLVTIVGASPPPCGNSGTVFKKRLNFSFTEAIRVMPPEDESGQLYGFVAEAVYDMTKLIGKGGRVPKGEEVRPFNLSLFTNHGQLVSALADDRS